MWMKERETVCVYERQCVRERERERESACGNEEKDAKIPFIKTEIPTNVGFTNLFKKP